MSAGSPRALGARSCAAEAGGGSLGADDPCFDPDLVVAVDARREPALTRTDNPASHPASREAFFVR
jgi:hypothetical protein